MSVIAKKNLLPSGNWETCLSGSVVREMHLINSSFFWHIEGYRDGKIRWIIEAHREDLRARIKETGVPHLAQVELGVIDECIFSVEGAAALSKVFVVIQEFFRIPEKHAAFLEESARRGYYYVPNRPRSLTI